MRIEINQEKFNEIVSRAQSTLERKSTRPILENILLQASGEELVLSATDLRVSLTQKTKCKVVESGSISVPGRKLNEIIREIPRGDVLVESKENNWITISSGNSTFHIPGTASEEFPSFPTPPNNFINIDPSVFENMLTKTIFASSNDETRMYLCGVYLKEWKDEDNNSFLKMVATDGHRLSLIDSRLQNGLALFSDGIIVPKKGVAEIKSIISTSGDSLKIACADGRIYVRSEDILLSVTLIDASFPNYSQVIPNQTGGGVLMSCEPFKDALRRVSILSDQETRSVLVEIEGSVMKLSSDNPGLGDAEETLSVDYSGEPVKVAFNANYLMDILKVMDDDEMRMEVKDSLSPTLFIGTDKDSSFLSVVMPMRVD
ncbi:MAG: DNA polymerase III subunit beta [Deltaproteobacteria bacterium]|nr:MAG: DNA polymerase III subunit beta [Deltaproteobacteria bacterium]